MYANTSNNEYAYLYIRASFVDLHYLSMKHILFIEDEPSLQKTLGDLLTQEGFDVSSSLDGEQGLEMAKKKHPDLILLDLILPKMNGFDVLQSLKQDHATKDIPVMVLTNLEGLHDVQKALDLGATMYLVKSDHHLQDILEKVKQSFND